MKTLQLTNRHLTAVRAALGVAELLEQRGDAGRASREQRIIPFITISRQAGAGGRALAEQLVARLNDEDPGELPWTSWDNELVHKVAEENGLPEPVVNAFEERRNSWFQDALSSLAFTDDPSHADEFKVYRRVAGTIQALADLGRVVIVGRGGVYLTRNRPGGIHLRLVAPLEHRVAHYARRYNLSEEAAAEQVQRIDHARNAFHRRYWPGEALLPETFTLTINTAAVPEDLLVDCVIPLVRNPAGTFRRRPSDEAQASGRRAAR